MVITTSGLLQSSCIGMCSSWLVLKQTPDMSHLTTSSHTTARSGVGAWIPVDTGVKGFEVGVRVGGCQTDVGRHSSSITTLFLIN